jgi:prevent-host-death family protein
MTMVISGGHMKQMAASTFKAKCLAVLRQVRTTGEPVVVTRRGKPDVKLTRIEPENDDIFGFMRGKIKVVGDIESPIPVEWKVMKRKKNK